MDDIGWLVFMSCAKDLEKAMIQCKVAASRADTLHQAVMLWTQK